MKIKFILVVTFLIFFSCKKAQQLNQEKPKVTTIQKVDPTIVKNNKPKTTTRIMLASTYRVDENNDDTKSLNKNWFELYAENGNYFIDSAVFSISKGFDECAGTDTKTIKTKRKTVLFIDNSGLTKGEIERVKGYKNKIWPNEETTFTFNKKKYSLRAEGNIESTEDRTEDDNKTSVWHKVSNYKLYLKLEGLQEEIIINEPTFEDTFVTLLFVGDIDKDGKPDFIFDAPRNYEEQRVILFLSSDAPKEKSVPKGVEISIMFDC